MTVLAFITVTLFSTNTSNFALTGTAIWTETYSVNNAPVCRQDKWHEQYTVWAANNLQQRQWTKLGKMLHAQSGTYL